MCKAKIFETKPLIPGLILFGAHLKTGRMPPPVVFLVDTGADVTLLSAGDAERLGIEYELSTEGAFVPFFGRKPLKEGPIMGGIAGRIQTYKVPDTYLQLITFLDGHVERHIEHLDLLYIPDGAVREVPSVLGMDVLSRFNSNWDFEKAYVDFTRLAKLGEYQISIGEGSAFFRPQVFEALREDFGMR